ncbi:hypothetical protein [Pokkaliibacter plantistimulans]|nr:hypothetical protein [Pokkaliibacter plantistimulans]
MKVKSTLLLVFYIVFAGLCHAASSALKVDAVAEYPPSVSARLFDSSLYLFANGQKISISCNDRVLWTDDIDSDRIIVQRNSMAGGSYISVSASSGYGGVNGFYAVFYLDRGQCVFAANELIANPSFYADHVESWERSGPITIRKRYQYQADGHLLQTSQLADYGDFCQLLSANVTVNIVSCETLQPAVFATISVEKTYLYRRADSRHPDKAYLMGGDQVLLTAFSEASGRIKIRYQGKRITEGWIDLSAVAFKSEINP